MATPCPTCVELTHDAELPRRPEEPFPTRWWHCDRCSNHLERYRGEADEGGLDDLEGYERACVAAERY